MIRSLYKAKDADVVFELDLPSIREAIGDESGLLWVSLECATDEEITSVLSDLFAFHHLAVEDARSFGYQAPKADDFASYLFIVVHALKLASADAQVESQELDVFLAANYLVTSFRSAAMPPIDQVWERLRVDSRLLERGADYLCHAVLDTVVDGYWPVLEQLDEEIDWLEDRIVDRPTQSMARRVLDLKHNTVTLRRIIGPQREVMNQLSRGDFDQIQARHRIYFRDIYDHLVRMHDVAESVRDVVADTLDIYLSVTANRTNEVMRVLTVVATIFMPLTFLAGVYGMNYRHFPEIGWRFGYMLFWLECTAIAAAMVWYFRRKRWL